MTDKATLLALAKRVERLDGPDRELDGEIARAMGWFTKPVTMRFAESGAEVTENYWTYPGDVRGAWSTVPPHSYTASIDAAMTLADEETAAQALREAFSFIQATGWPVGDFKGALARATAAAALRAHAETQP